MMKLAETMSTGLNSLSRCLLPDRFGAWLKSREIDAMLKRDRLLLRKFSVMILVAGSWNSGKSTVLRQLRVIYGPAFTHKELLEFREAIYDNVVKGMHELVDARHYLGIPLQNSANEEHEMLFSSFAWHMKLEPCTFQPYVEAIDSLWKDSGIQEAHLRRSEKGMYETLKYYFDNIHRIGKLNYLPHNQDVIYAQKYWRTLADEYFVIPDSRFAAAYIANMNIGVDRALKTAFQAPVLFIVRSSDYDQNFCGENSLVDMLKGFECFCKNKRYLYSTIIIFFNKMDLLEEKIQTSDIRKHFPEFQGDPHKLEDVQEFLVQSFQKRSNSRKIFYYMTSAVDTENIREVFEKVKLVILYNVSWEFSETLENKKIGKNFKLL